MDGGQRYEKSPTIVISSTFLFIQRNRRVQLKFHVGFPLGKIYNLVILFAREFTFPVAILFIRQGYHSLIVATPQIVGQPILRRFCTKF